MKNKIYNTQGAYQATYADKDCGVRKLLRKKAAYEHKQQKPQVHHYFHGTKDLAQHLILTYIVNNGI